MAKMRIEYTPPEGLAKRSPGLGNPVSVLKSLAAYVYCFNEEHFH